MFSSWLWFVVMFAVLMPWVGYGWGYRGWGPPYPRYIQRRRGQRGAADGVSAPFRYDGWGWHGDAVWWVLLIGLCWVFAAPYFGR